ncbi:battenin CLN3 protein [Trapelia coarctata]|nr:battenin CLN3 protein [Trapelia coarctata]
MYRARIKAAFDGADPRVCLAFWLFGIIIFFRVQFSNFCASIANPSPRAGLINNVLYVIILSAALDLVGPTVPKGVVLLADVIPSFLTKLVAPYFIHLVPYPVRILIFALLSTAGMLLIALTPAFTEGGTVPTKMMGVVLASLSSGGGELSFLGLTHFYGAFSLASWGSGTGAAGLVGAGAYALATTVLGMGVKTTLLLSAVLPAVMLVAFFVILPRGPMMERNRYKKLPNEALAATIVDHVEAGEEESTLSAAAREDEGLLDVSSRAPNDAKSIPWLHTFWINLRRARGLFFPYMLPLLLVYIAEYTINQGVAPTLLFDLKSPSTPFSSYRSFYPTYSFIYQAGVFIARSSLPILRLRHLYPPSFLQILNLALLILQAMFDFLPNVWWVFVIVFWEGLLGGIVYVNTFAKILEEVKGEDGEREFSLGAVSVSDSGGIMVAGVLGIGLEVALCGWQVKRGKDWCMRFERG